MKYELYYWPSIQGRGEFVRLSLEDAGADYIDVARRPQNDAAGMAGLLQFMDDETVERPAFAPPILKAGKLVIGQTANILLFLGQRHNLAPKSETGRLWAHQLQLTMTDFTGEIHDTHHPVSSNLYYEDQRKEALVKSANFLKFRAPKFLGYFETILERNSSGDKYLVGARRTYADLSLFQIIDGLRYAYPRNMPRLEKNCPRVAALYQRISGRPRIRAYIKSDRRIAFNEDGLFRNYPELDK